LTGRKTRSVARLSQGRLPLHQWRPGRSGFNSDCWTNQIFGLLKLLAAIYLLGASKRG
jgi:hypothetical protein